MNVWFGEWNELSLNLSYTTAIHSMTSYPAGLELVTTTAPISTHTGNLTAWLHYSTTNYNKGSQLMMYPSLSVNS